MCEASKQKTAVEFFLNVMDFCSSVVCVLAPRKSIVIHDSYGFWAFSQKPLNDKLCMQL